MPIHFVSGVAGDSAKAVAAPAEAGKPRARRKGTGSAPQGSHNPRPLSPRLAKTGGKPETDAPGETIHFYSASADYGCFSNFSPDPILLKGKTWPTSEHYFQAQKFAGTPDEEEVRQATSPMVAARMGRSRQRPLRKDWETAKDSIMYEAVLAKFTQHAELREILLATGDSVIVEHAKNDIYWGDGGDGSGKNRLGEILMRVREELRAMPRTSDPATRRRKPRRD